MAFLFGVVTFVLGAVLVGICLFAIPGPGGQPPVPGGGHGHGHGGH